MSRNVDRNPQESAAAEGLPDPTQDLPPGKDIETSEQARMMPRDHSVASGSDPAYAVTAEEQRRRESPSDRHTREEPDFGEASPGASRWREGESPEETAMRTTRNP